MNKFLNQISHAFDLAASSYNKNATIQRQTADQLIKMIVSVNTDFDNVIDAGCGTGMMTMQLARAITFRTFTACDISPSSLAQASLLPANIQRLKYDFNDIGKLPTQFDLVFANMALHWSTSFTDTLSVLRTSLTRNGILAFSIPLAGTFREIEKNYSTRDFYPHKSVTDFLTRSGYTILQTNISSHTLFYDTTLSALRAIKQTGVTHTPNRKHKSLLTMSYLAKHPVSALTYVTGYFIAVKSHE